MLVGLFILCVDPYIMADLQKQAMPTQISISSDFLDPGSPMYGWCFEGLCTYVVVTILSRSDMSGIESGYGGRACR